MGVASSDFHCLKNRPAAEGRKDGRTTPVHTEQNAGVVQALWVEVGGSRHGDKWLDSRRSSRGEMAPPGVGEYGS